MFDQKLADEIARLRIVAVLTIDDADDAIPLAEALASGGVNVIELTLRTPAALTAIGRIRQARPDIRLGAGTVIFPEQVGQVIDAGAHFAVSPGTSRRVLQAARERGLSFAPGVCSPSDIEATLEFDCRLLKYFPAETSGGLKHLTAMAAPYDHLGLRFMPLGGLNADNAAGYLASPLVAALGGSWIAPRNLIRKRDWKRITENAAAAAKLAGGH